MNRARAASWISAVMTAASIVAACNDVGDSSAIPDEDASASDAKGSAEDGTVSPADTGPVETRADATSEQGSTPGAEVEDTSATDSAVEDTGVEDASTADSTLEDTGAPDSSLEDTGIGDSAAVDTGTPDSAVVDTGVLAVDTGAPDTGTVDAGSVDSAVADAGVEDTGMAVDASDGGGLRPCTAASQTGCVPCAGNATGICTTTEAAFVQQDIDQGNATAAGGDGAAGCYPCLFMSGCIDDTAFGDQGNECDDLMGTFDAGAQSGTADSALCLATLACILRTSCTALPGVGTPEISNCYCGPTHAGSVCAAAGSGVNGACLMPEVDGLGFDASDNTDILKNFTNTAFPAGRANQILQCAISNTCTACLQ